MSETNAKITWEEHDETDYGWQSTCGRFETRIDPIYGYHSLHLTGDSESHCESTMLDDLTRQAEWMIAHGKAPAEPVI